MKRWERKIQKINAAAADPDAGLMLEGVLKIEAAAGDSNKARRFSLMAYGGGELLIGRYDLPVVVDLAGMSFRGKQLPTYYGHHDGSDGSRLLGHSDQHDKSSGKLVVSGVFSAATPFVNEILAAAENGYEWQASIGALPEAGRLQEIRAGKQVTVNGREFTGPIIVARKSVLRHIAILPEGADASTKVKIAAQAVNTNQKEYDMKFNQWVESMGLVLAELRDDQTEKLEAKYAAELKAAEGKMIEGQAKTVEPPKFDLDACVATHRKYVAAIDARVEVYKDKIGAAELATIRAEAGTKAAEIKAQALNDEWPDAKMEVALVKAQADAEVALIRAERPKAPAIHASTRDVKPDAIEAAFCMAAGLRGVEKAFKPETLEAAATLRHSEGVSLQSMIIAAAEANGYDTPTRRIHRGNFDLVMKAAFPSQAPIHASSFSTHSLTTMLSTVGNKFLLEGFNFVEQVWREISSIRPVNDFKAVTSYRMLDDLEFEQIGPAGEIKHGTVSQESYTNQAETYAKMLAITRTDIINDDLGAFDSIRERIGVGCGKKLNSVFWTAFLDDATFFNATAVASGGHANLLTTALGEAGIAAANVLLKAQVGTDGHPLGLGMQHLLLTGATLSPTAKKWYVSQEVRDTTSSTKTPTTNIYYNQFRPVESAYITDTSDWYLLPIGGGSMAPMEVCFLDGVQNPTIESADADFNTLGIQFRGYFDFGVAFKEWRASVKSTGAG